MKNIAVITMSHSLNYGGVLQSVALNRALKKRGADVTFLVHQPPLVPYKSVKAYLAQRKTICSSAGVKNKIRMAGGIAKTVIENRNYFNKKAKIARFQAFRNELKDTPYYANCEAIKAADLHFDCYITGSDQVWNSKFSHGKLDPCYMLEFVEGDAKKYAYAASTGGKKPVEEIRQICERVKDFSGVSVREDSLRKQLAEQGTDALTVADPTLLISREVWRSLEKPVKLPEHYILVYCLDYDPALDACIQKVAEKTGYPVIDVFPNVSRVKSKSKKQCMRFGPAEFLYAMDHADCVLTNSFHALAFSYVFDKKFGCVLRRGQEERMTDFLDLLCVGDRVISPQTYEKALEEIRYSIADIEQLIQTSNDYLDHIVSTEVCK